MRPVRCRLFVLVLLASFPFLLAAQSAFLDKDQRGTNFGFKVDAGSLGPGGLVLSKVSAAGMASWSLDGFVDIGASVTVIPAMDDSIGSGEVDVSVSGTFTILKQDRMMPLSLSIPGQVKKNFFKSQALDAGGLVKTGTGYRLGLEFFRYFRADWHLYLRLGAFVEADLNMVTTEKLSGVSDGSYPKVQSSQTLGVGLIAGFSLRPNRANRGVALSFDLRPFLDSQSNATLAAVVNFSLVETKLDRVQE